METLEERLRKRKQECKRRERQKRTAPEREFKCAVEQARHVRLMSSQQRREREERMRKELQAQIDAMRLPWPPVMTEAERQAHIAKVRHEIRVALPSDAYSL